MSDTINFTTSVATLYQDQPSAVHSDQVTGAGLKERFNRGMLSVRPTGRFSPHMLMGKIKKFYSNMIYSYVKLL